MITKYGAFQENIKVRRLNKIVEIQMGKILQNPNFFLKFKKLQLLIRHQKKKNADTQPW